MSAEAAKGGRLAILKNDSFETRAYQTEIAKTAAEKNTLVVLPTGMGKTLIAVIVGAERLDKYGGKIMITAPTRPLNAQHTKSFEQFTHIPKEDIALITGRYTPEKREQLYKKATIVAATPQCVQNDLEKGRLNLSDFTFVVFDEAHRAVKNYAYTYVAKKYMLQAKHPLILGLTASPGSSREKINQITENLFIEAVEIRSETDGDVQPYVQDIEREWIYVDFPEKYQRVKALLEECLRADINWLKEKHYIPTYKPSKKMLLEAQRRVAASYSRARKNFGALWAMIRSAEAIKLEHAIELLETQGIPFLYDYFEKIKASKKRTDQRMLKNRCVDEAVKIVEEMHAAGEEHPKMKKMRELVKDILSKNEKAKIMIFANYRFTVDRIKDLLDKDEVKSKILIGQAIKDGKGMTQQQQIEIIKRFKNEEFSVLICSSIGEEGLDIEEVSAVIFFESVPSEIRKIQRSGRTGRTVPGRVIFLITKNTRDEAYYYSAVHKEKRMKGILYEMRNGRGLRKKKSLLDWTK